MIVEVKRISRSWWNWSGGTVRGGTNNIDEEIFETVRLQARGHPE